MIQTLSVTCHDPSLKILPPIHQRIFPPSFPPPLLSPLPLNNRKILLLLPTPLYVGAGFDLNVLIIATSRHSCSLSPRGEDHFYICLDSPPPPPRPWRPSLSRFTFPWPSGDGIIVLGGRSTAHSGSFHFFFYRRGLLTSVVSRIHPSPGWTEP